MGAGSSHCPGPGFPQLLINTTNVYLTVPCDGHPPPLSLLELGDATAKCRPCFLSVLRRGHQASPCRGHPDPAATWGVGAGAATAFKLPVQDHFKSQTKAKPGTNSISFQAPRAESRVLGGNRVGAFLVGTITVPRCRWRNWGSERLGHGAGSTPRMCARDRALRLFEP